MNWFIFMAGALYLGGAAMYITKGSWELGLTFVCYAMANFLLARLG